MPSAESGKENAHLTAKDRPYWRRPLLQGVAICAVLLAGGLAASAATLQRTADIQIQVLDVSSSANLPMNGVAVSVAPRNGGASCTNTTATTANATNAVTRKAASGIATFHDCSDAASKKAYVVTGATFAGFNIAPNNPHPINTGVFHVFAGKRKKRTTVLRVYLIQAGVTTPGSVPPPAVLPPGIIPPGGTTPPGTNPPPGTTPSPGTAPAPGTTPPPGTTPVPAPTPPPGAGVDHAVTIGDDFFSPAATTMNVGDTITFTYPTSGKSLHTATRLTGPTTFDSGNLNPGGHYVFHATVSGDYTYDCSIHGTKMSGTIHVN